MLQSRKNECKDDAAKRSVGKSFILAFISFRVLVFSALTLFVTGNNQVIRDNFLTQEADLSDYDLTDKVISWTAKNSINGLMYGNGGIKCWPKQKVLSMRTHENADPDNKSAQVDFCWDLQYIQQNSC